MAQTRALVRAAARRRIATSGDVSCRPVNALLAPDLGENRFVSMIAVDVAPQTRGIRWANAGHVPGYVLDRAGRVKAELASTGVVLGLFPDAAFATEHGPALECGDLLVLFTDGVTEAEAPDGAMSGAEWALDVVRAHAHRSSAGSSTRSATPSSGSPMRSAQHDDVTAIVCRVRD